VKRLRRALWVAGSPLRRVLIGMIWIYQRTFSGIMGGRCRFSPTCSEYARQAIQSVGAVRGVGLGAWRVLRCSPLSTGGVDRPPAPVLYDGDIHQGAQARP
jgi:uncharacterized protein